MNRFTFINGRVVWVFRLLFLIIVFMTVVSCASFNSTSKNPKKLTDKNISALNGIYEIKTAVSDSIGKVHGYKHWYYNNFFKEIDRKLIKDTLAIDSTRSYAFQLKVETPKLIRINYIVNDSVYRSRTIKTKIMNDGYLKLKNKNLQILLVPYLLGGIDIKRSRITVDENQNLLLDVGQHRSGGALIILIDSRSNAYRRKYERISDN